MDTLSGPLADRIEIVLGNMNDDELFDCAMTCFDARLARAKRLRAQREAFRAKARASNTLYNQRRRALLLSDQGVTL